LRFGKTLVIDPRHRTVAVAVFKDGKLVDCRMRSVPRDGTVSQRARDRIVPYLIQCLDTYNPHGVLVPEAEAVGTRERSNASRRIVQAVSREAARRGMAVHRISRADIYAWMMWNGRKTRNPDEISREVIRRYPELTAMLPAPRTVWEPEQHFKPLFNVAAMYVAWVRKLSNTPMA
jgi:hypothetical protein